MPVNDTIRTEWVWQLNLSDFAVNVLHYTSGVTTDWVQSHSDSFASEVAGLFTSTTLRADYPTGLRLDRIVTRDLRTEGNGPLVSTIGLAGTAASNPLPGQNAIVTTLRTTDGSRRGRGRIYWPPTAATQTGAGGEVPSAIIADFVSFMNGILSVTAGEFGDVELGVYSRSDNITRTVTSHTTDNVFDVQTRRRDLSIV